MPTITGHHHVSMMTKNATVNHHFYTKVLGLRLVKKTVNQDDPSMYHLFYGDKTGSPGTELSFFEMPQIGQTHKGTNAITRIGLLVNDEASLTYWQERLTSFGIPHEPIESYANRPAIHFTDPDGLQLVIQAGNGEKAAYWEAWSASPVPKIHQMLGIGTVEMTVSRLNKLARTLTELFGYEEVSHHKEEAIFQAIAGQTTGEILVKQVEGIKERPGRGSIHHLAIRVKDEAELVYWNEQVIKRGFHSTGMIDRYYFKSLYFRESNGIVIEIATDGPGFTVDSTEKDLGKKLALPPFLEMKRKEIEANLKPIEEAE